VDYDDAVEPSEVEWAVARLPEPVELDAGLARRGQRPFTMLLLAVADREYLVRRVRERVSTVGWRRFPMRT
jgi:hypothetical protein